MTTVKKLKEPTKKEMRQMLIKATKRWIYCLHYRSVLSVDEVREDLETITLIRKKLNL